MLKKLIRQKYFVSKELRISIALIILWSLLVTAFFTYFAKEYGGKIMNGNLLFVIVMLGYVLIVVVLTMFFSHRLIGPFQRLMTEMRLIRSGDYHRRLNVRTSDDIYIRSFIKEVNKILEKYDKVHKYNNKIIKHIDSELISIISIIEEGEASKEKLRENVLAFHRKLKSLAGDQ
jgi:nitrogen fixation/metabolism regulation signal transduction histidine kinase